MSNPTSDLKTLCHNVATPEQLPFNRDEETARAYMNCYADLQKFKLKVVVALGLLAWAAHGFPGWLS